MKNYKKILLFTFMVFVGVCKQYASLDDQLLAATLADDATQVQNLLNQGADINTLDSTNRPPLTLAIEQGYLDIVELLLGLGAQTDPYPAPLIWATIYDQMAIIEYLITQGADVNATTINAITNNGSTALMWACVLGLMDIVQLLLTQSVNVNAQDDNNSTALMWAASRGWVSIVQLLLTHGADYTIEDLDGATALDFATTAYQDPTTPSSQQATLYQIIQLLQAYESLPSLDVSSFPTELPSFDTIYRQTKISLASQLNFNTISQSDLLALEQAINTQAAATYQTAMQQYLLAQLYAANALFQTGSTRSLKVFLFQTLPQQYSGFVTFIKGSFVDNQHFLSMQYVLNRMNISNS